ncbi:iron-hydroxamate ABC transporter substrate-binding protein [Gracilibacillus caseinilyticus]|uniref:Iron-hydroxamate ABC transporter substrate-binding protein n=1 Tax=Gracilibacillus caseinilyticus TaxID=2932256 RepID=A0ABY4F2R2_9BACI|nr:iron-hydroxamate ABC transporter substrate-binding protein [Gracilibacillus caseinilyticus]UOQ50357.1 iron-hydroxamate ABC transporter substrate-binding protein [Gracilibacillus caseinilyticus]
MKKVLIAFLFVTALLLAACGNTEDSTSTDEADTQETSNQEQAAEEASSSETFTYDSEEGPMELPANPQRIVALSYAPNVLALGGNVVGVDEWTYNNPIMEDKLEGIESVTEESLEKIIELDPDLIIVGSWLKNIDKLKEIAPTVSFTYGKLSYLEQHEEIGKVLNKEQEAKDWVENFKARATQTGEEIKAKIGEDATVSVLENDVKQMAVFGDNWGRGTELLYQELELNMPEKVKEKALADGYYSLSLEVISDFAGDYIVLSKNPDGDTSLLETETWNNIPAVQNGNVLELNTHVIADSDPITLEYLLEQFSTFFLGSVI